MKVEINNLGPINKFEFDFKRDLNIIFGKNNIGKSYAITVLYLVLKNLSQDNYGWNIIDFRYFAMNEFIIGKNSVNEVAKLERIVRNKFKNNDKDIDVTKEIENIFAKVLKHSFLIGFEKSLNNSFASIKELSNKFSNNKLSVKLTFKNFEFEISIDDDHKLIVKSVNSFNKVFVKKSVRNRSYNISRNEITIYINTKNERDEDIYASEGILKFIMKTYADFKYEFNNHISGIYFLPASRSGLYQALSTFSAVIAELSKSRNFLQNKIELPNISEPVSDYFLYLSNIGKKQFVIKNIEIAKKIEKDILKGKVHFNQDSKKIVFLPNKFESELDLSVTSSMVSEIAPIVAFLKYIIKDNTEGEQLKLFSSGYKKKNSYDLIFIEEPEAHLHPEIQVLMMEIFALIVKNNIKLVMTSHSNYMFNKLSNLVLENKINYNSVGSYLMEMKERGSVLDEYKMKAEKEGIEDYNFSDVAENLYNERLKIYGQLSENAD